MTHVVVETAGSRIVGYVTLLSAQILLNELPSEVSRRLTRNTALPAVLLGRMAVDTRYQQRGLGKFLLMYGLYRSWEISQSVGCYAVVIDAKNERVKEFYQQFQFRALEDQPLRLFLPMATIDRLVMELKHPKGASG